MLICGTTASIKDAGNDWPHPLPITSTLPPVPPFDPELLPERVRHYVMDVADRQQAPPDFAAVAALCGLAAVLGNTVKIAPKAQDDWTVTPNLWGAIIGRPSAMKSPAMAAALAPVYALQDEMRRQWEADCKEDAVNDALAGLDVKEAKKRAAKLLKDGDRDAARSAILSAAGDEDERQPCPRLIINDATVEKAGELLNENERGLLLVRDELPGFLARMESEEYQSERAFYLEAFNGDGRFTYDRIGRGTIEIKNCTLSLIGGVQPSRIAPIVRGAITGASNDGLIQRLQMAVWPDDIAEWRWVDRIPRVLERLDYDRAFTDLRAISLDDQGNPTVLRFTPEAQGMFREWMMEIQTEARGGTLPTTLESHILKMPKTVASLALIFELVEGGRTAVGAIATARALDWADYLRSHANRLYAAGATMAEDGARLMIERRAQLPDPFTVRDVQRRQWAGLADRDAVVSSIEALLATHHCRDTSEGSGPQGGRPTVTYRWNPLLQVGG
ncbi:YfjI family protein [Pseudoxanthobacter sp. M-2]|uniref:YfjI family protein n=1 Tax=Pseudoxanthobacter sp. M-2 TaxID=3078754 RepID=UPI0038FD14B0